jgi:hypothetical protein
MADSGQVPLERTEFEIRVNGRSFRRSTLGIVLFFLAYVAVAVFVSGGLHLIAIAGAAVFGIIGLSAGLAGAWQIRREPMMATLNDYGVTFRRHDPVSWQSLAEVRLITAKPRLLFALRPLHYIAFLPARAAGLPRPSPWERLPIKMYGTKMLLMTETVTPAADDILAAVERLSDVPVRR